MIMKLIRNTLLVLTLAGALSLAALPFLLFGCNKPAPTLKDNQGREFVRVREMKPRGDGTSDAELWQLKGKVGAEHPTFLKLLTPEGTPPLFTQTAP